MYIYIIHNILSNSSSSLYLVVSETKSILYPNPIYATGFLLHSLKTSELVEKGATLSAREPENLLYIFIYTVLRLKGYAWHSMLMEKASCK